MDSDITVPSATDWIITGPECVERFEIQDPSIWKTYCVVKVYCDGRRMPLPAFGLDLRSGKAMAEQEGMLTRLLTRIRKDPALDEINRELMTKYIRWHRSLYRWVIDGYGQKAVRELESVPGRMIGQEPLGGAANG